jgi:Uma2 family endonuclease
MVVRQKLTLEEFLKLPSSERLEFIDGEVIEKVSPSPRHAAIQKKLIQLLDRLVGTRLLVLPEVRCIFGPDRRALIPDVSVIARDDFEPDPKGELPDEFTFPPRLAFEVLSPGQSAGLLLNKISYYMANGVAIAVVVDPEMRSATVYRPGQSLVSLDADSSLELAPVLDGSIELAELFEALKA